ncbi:MAG TPA: FAD binding domain-containing protein [Gaiellaceae bacterium]|nr:FAD binding domain-containing protein [Gaiellaceae bacterium]
MKPAPFAYVRAESLEEAAAALAAGERETKVIAGGQSLVPALSMRLLRPDALVDINRVLDLDNVARADGALVVGATARQADPRLHEHPLLAEALAHVGHVATRNRGTVCGSVAHADPAAELPLCLVLLEGSVRARSVRGEREIAARDFFLGPYTTALAADELVVETRWPLLPPGTGAAFVELAQRHGDYALCTAGALADADGGALRVAVGAVAERPLVLDVDPEAPGESAAAQVTPWGTVHASPGYLRHLVRALVERAVARARERAEAA